MGLVGLYFVYKPLQVLYSKYKPGADMHACSGVAFKMVDWNLTGMNLHD